MASNPVFIIAEIGSNHNGNYEVARTMIEHAAASGAQAAKFQTFRADALYSPLAPRLSEMSSFAGVSESTTPHQLASQLEIDRSWHEDLARHCSDVGIEFMSTPFDLEAVDELDPHVARHKIASFDLTNRELLEAVAATGKPLVVSTGHAYLGEVETALGWICAVDPSADVTLLHCTSQYPTIASDVHLRAMETMRSAFGYPVGLSDHTIGNAISLAAVALGAVMLERHVTEDVTSAGPDHHFALEPDVLSALVRDAESVRAALGSAVKAPTSAELENRQLARRSIHVGRDLTAGHELTRDDLTVVRPALGIEPADLHIVVGRRLIRDLAAGSPLRWSDV